MCQAASLDASLLPLPLLHNELSRLPRKHSNQQQHGCIQTAVGCLLLSGVFFSHEAWDRERGCGEAVAPSPQCSQLPKKPGCLENAPVSLQSLAAHRNVSNFEASAPCECTDVLGACLLRPNKSRNAINASRLFLTSLEFWPGRGLSLP